MVEAGVPDHGPADIGPIGDGAEHPGVQVLEIGAVGLGFGPARGGVANQAVLAGADDRVGRAAVGIGVHEAGSVDVDGAGIDVDEDFREALVGCGPVGPELVGVETVAFVGED